MPYTDVTHPSRAYKLLGVGMLVVTLLALGYLLPSADTKLLAVVIAAVAFAIGLAVFGVDLATWAFVFVLFINLPGIATSLYGISPVAAGAVFLLLLVPCGYYLLLKREKPIVDSILMLMLLFLVALLASSLVALDTGIALGWIGEYLIEGVVQYFLIINVVRNLDALKRVIWGLVLAAGLLGSLSVYQELALDYDNHFGGLAQRQVMIGIDETEHEIKGDIVRTREKVGGTNRAGGPFENPNRYAQMLLMVLPLAFFIFQRQRGSWTLKSAAGISVLLAASAILLTYSRGAFVTLVLILGILVLFGYIRWHKALAAILVVLALGVTVAPGYFVRVHSILGAESMVSDSASVVADNTTRGRLTEMLAALLVYLDHPVLGVGPGQYLPYYSVEYMDNPAIAFRELNHPRRAHTLYFELAAETGTFGIAVFMGIVALTLYQLLLVRRRWAQSRPDLTDLATAFFVAIIGYLGTAIFLHFAYQRYFWLVLALAGALIRIANTEGAGEKLSAPTPDGKFLR